MYYLLLFLIELHGHQAAVGLDVRVRRQHDQGQEPRGHPPDIQYHKRLLARRGGAGAGRKQVV